LTLADGGARMLSQLSLKPGEEGIKKKVAILEMN
jgi:hypothetical protein